MFEIGDKVRIKKEHLKEYSDYKEHAGEIATIIEPHTEDPYFDCELVWDNGDESSAKWEYLEPAFTTWKERYQ